MNEKQPKVSTSYNLPVPLIATIREEAARQHRSASALVGMVMEEWLKKQKLRGKQDDD